MINKKLNESHLDLQSLRMDVTFLFNEQFGVDYMRVYSLAHDLANKERNE